MTFNQNLLHDLIKRWPPRKYIRPLSLSLLRHLVQLLFPLILMSRTEGHKHENEAKR